eukprot:gene9353-6700_t
MSAMSMRGVQPTVVNTAMTLKLPVDTSHRSIHHRQTRACHRQCRHEEPVGVDSAVCTIDDAAAEQAQQHIVHRPEELVVQSIGG